MQESAQNAGSVQFSNCHDGNNRTTAPKKIN